jgi:hypothetical protein
MPVDLFLMKGSSTLKIKTNKKFWEELIAYFP